MSYMIFDESCPPQVKWRVMDRFCSTLIPEDHAGWRIFEHMIMAEAPEMDDLVEYDHLQRALSAFLDKKREGR